LINERRELIVNGKKFIGSNITDTFYSRFFSKEGRTTTPAHGSMELAKVLASENIPRTYIGNAERLKLIYNKTTPEKI